MEPQFFPSTSEAPRSPRWGFFFSGGAIGHDRAPVQETRDEVCGADHQRGTSTPSLTGAPEANSARSRAAVDGALRGDHRGAQGALRIGEAVSLRWADVDAAVCAFDSRAQRRSVTVRVGCCVPPAVAHGCHRGDVSTRGSRSRAEGVPGNHRGPRSPSAGSGVQARQGAALPPARPSSSQGDDLASVGRVCPRPCRTDGALACSVVAVCHRCDVYARGARQTRTSSHSPDYRS